MKLQTTPKQYPLKFPFFSSEFRVIPKWRLTFPPELMAEIFGLIESARSLHYLIVSIILLQPRTSAYKSFSQQVSDRDNIVDI